MSKFYVQSQKTICMYLYVLFGKTEKNEFYVQNDIKNCTHFCTKENIIKTIPYIYYYLLHTVLHYLILTLIYPLNLGCVYIRDFVRSKTGPSWLSCGNRNGILPDNFLSYQDFINKDAVRSVFLTSQLTLK